MYELGRAVLRALLSAMLSLPSLLSNSFCLKCPWIIPFVCELQICAIEPREDEGQEDDDGGERRAAGLRLGAVMLRALSQSLLIFTGQTWQV